MNEFLTKLSESLMHIDGMIESLELLPITPEMKKDYLQHLENAWIEVFAVYDLLSDMKDLLEEELTWN